MMSEWQTKTLDEVLVKTATVNPTDDPEKEFDYIDVSSVSNVTFTIEATQRLKGKDAPSRARKLVRSGDVLFATIRPTLKRIAVVPPELDSQVCSTGYFLLRATDEIYQKFLFYSLLRPAFMGAMESLQKGASYPAVTDAEVRAQPLTYPRLYEQKRIVAILDEAFEGIATAKANAENNLRNARALFEGHLQYVFSRRAETAVLLGNVCEFVGGSQPPKSVFEHKKTAENIRLIQIRDYKNDKHLVYIPRNLARRFCAVDDVMIGRYGPPIFQILRGLEGAYNVALMKAVPNESMLSRDFLFYFLKHPAIFQYVNFHAERAAGQIGLTKETLERYPFVLPPLVEQKNTVDRIIALESDTQRLAAIQERKLAALDELKKSLLHQAFSGKL